MVRVFRQVYLERGGEALDGVKALGARLVEKELRKIFSRGP